MTTFTTTCGHSGSIKPVQKIGGVMEGKWVSLVKGNKVAGSSGVKSLYSAADMSSAKQKIAQFLRISPAEIHVLGGSAPSTPSGPTKSYISAPSSNTASPNQLDKYEASPNGMAKCRACFQKIEKGSHRIGKWSYIAVYDKYQYVYYHDRCIPADIEVGLCLPSSPTPNAHRKMNEVLQDEIAYQNKEKVKQSKIVFQDRGDLREALRRLRKLFADRLHVPPYQIFGNATLDDIVYKLPETKQDLLDCRGIAEKRYKNFGPAILQVVGSFSYQQQHQQQRKIPTTPRSNTTPSGAEKDSGNSPVLVTESLTCEQIVDRRFKDAAQSGEVISIDI
jgi:hypothetical protein